MPRSSAFRLWSARLTPVALAAFAGVVATDLAYCASANLTWLHFSSWLLLAGLAAGAAALAARMLAGDRLAALLLAAALAVGTVNFLFHMRDGWTAVVPEGLILSIAGAALMLGAAWAGRRP
jgi:uncharacterized membrane protein